MVSHLNISDIPFDHCISSDKAVVSSSGNAVVYCQTTVPHLNISDIPFNHCIYTGLSLILHCFSTSSFLCCYMAEVMQKCTPNLHCITTALPLDNPLHLHCNGTAGYHCFITDFTLDFHFYLVRGSLMVLQRLCQRCSYKNPPPLDRFYIFPMESTKGIRGSVIPPEPPPPNPTWICTSYSTPNVQSILPPL